MRREGEKTLSVFRNREFRLGELEFPNRGEGPFSLFRTYALAKSWLASIPKFPHTKYAILPCLYVLSEKKTLSTGADREYKADFPEGTRLADSITVFAEKKKLLDFLGEYATIAPRIIEPTNQLVLLWLSVRNAVVSILDRIGVITASSQLGSYGSATRPRG